jgi:hypothetical protein
MTKETGAFIDQGETALVRCSTTKGPLVMEFHRDWAPHGYDRAVELFEKGAWICSSRPRTAAGAVVGGDFSHRDALPPSHLGQVTMTTLTSFE